MPAVDGAGTVLAHAGSHFGRAGDGVHLAGVARAGGVRSLQGSRGALGHFLRRTRESPAEPGVSQGGVGRHPGGRVPLQTPPDEV